MEEEEVRQRPELACDDEEPPPPRLQRPTLALALDPTAPRRRVIRPKGWGQREGGK